MFDSLFEFFRAPVNASAELLLGQESEPGLHLSLGGRVTGGRGFFEFDVIEA